MTEQHSVDGGQSVTRKQWLNLSLGSGIALAIVGIAFIANDSNAHAREPLGKNWSSGQLISMDQIDHANFDALLGKYVDADGYVDYSAWRNSQSDRQALQNYLTHLSQASTEKSSSKESRLAFWINAYNAVTLEGILQVYPTKSIRDHTSKLGGYNIWDDLPLLVGGTPYSLNEIEHQVLRKMNEPRIHFAIVCASIGCPRLRNEAYLEETIDQQLADNSKDFFNRSQNLKVEDNTLYLSSILNWFGEDFGDSQSQQLKTIQPYFPEKAHTIASNQGTKVKFQKYDWTLNDIKNKSR